MCIRKWFILLFLCTGASLVGLAGGALGCKAGPLASRFPQTLRPGWRTEVLGPLLSWEQSGAKRQWSVSPLVSGTRDTATDSTSWDFLYPLLTYHRFGTESRFQFIQLLSLSRGNNAAGQAKKQFTLFPFYFQQRSPKPDENYTAILPFYGHLKNRLFRDEIRFLAFPAYVEIRKKDEVTDSYLFPFFALRHGEKLHGWKLWPLLGYEEKGLTTHTNGFGDIERVGGRRKLFVGWPFFFDQHTGIGTSNPQHQQALLPFYSYLRSPQRDSTTLVWPFFTYTNDREKRYREWDAPWPLIVFARGSGKTANRVWPFFSRAHNATQESDWYLWPVYKYRRIHSTPLEWDRTRILFFLFSRVRQTNTVSGAWKTRTDLWPLFTRRRDLNGNERLQILAPLEPFLPDNPSIERNYSPLWSVWRAEHNAQTGAASQSLLWNLYRRTTAPGRRSIAGLFGLFQYSAGPEGRQLRLFYLPAVHW